MDKLNFLKGDDYADILCNIMILSGPFIAVGWIGNIVVAYIACAVGIAALLCLIARIYYCARHSIAERSPRARHIMSELLFPYSILLSSLIIAPEGKIIACSLWFTVFICILIIIEYIVSLKKEN